MVKFRNPAASRIAQNWKKEKTPLMKVIFLTVAFLSHLDHHLSNFHSTQESQCRTMHPGNIWGGSLEISATDSIGEEDRSRNQLQDWDKASFNYHQKYNHLDETRRSWLLRPPEKKKKKHIDLGCIVCSTMVFKWHIYAIVIAFILIGLPIIIVKSIPKHKHKPQPPDNYTVALHKSLLFFNAQKSGKLPKNNGIPWRGNSGLRDGSTLTDVKGGLVGGYYDAGDNIKFHFPMSYAITMLSWSAIEYEHKYRAIGEYDHVRELIKWGTDYLLLTFDSTATRIDKVYSQVGVGRNDTNTPDDHSCWERPEDMDYIRPVQISSSAPDLGGEMAAALAAASIVFRDDTAYSSKLAKGAQTVFAFARNFGRRTPYSSDNPAIYIYYNSTSYWDEYMWGAAWVYYATGNVSYLTLATHPDIAENTEATYMNPDARTFSWNNKLPGAMLLLTRFRMFLNPGYPYEETLRSYHDLIGLNMCSYFQMYKVFNFTKAGLIQMDHNRGQNLQYVANAAFLASLFADYMSAADVPGWYCGSTFMSLYKLKGFARSQIDYILGKNPLGMSYVVGYGPKYPKRVHHRAASIPYNHVKYSCSDGWKWANTKNPNPNIINGAMVGGPDKFDKFLDVRQNFSYTEATMAGNAALTAALMSLTTSPGIGVDKNIMFSFVPPLYPPSPPPPRPWKP